MSKLLTGALVAFLVLLSTGCETVAERQTYTDDDSTEYSISGQSNALSQLTIFINGEAVIQDKQTHEDMEGTYNGKPVRALCTTQTGLVGSQHNCEIYIDESYAADLHFQ